MVYQWDGHAHQVRWKRIDGVKIELPRETIIEAEFVTEIRGEVCMNNFIIFRQKMHFTK